MYQAPPYPPDEEERLAALRRYRILDTEPEVQFDRIVELAKRRFEAPIALVGFMDAERNFLKARCDLPLTESPRDISFCGYTILDDEVLVVPDATKDERFAENPLVVGDFHVRFYAGAPLIAASGHRIGTVCVFDTEARASFGDDDRQDLQDLASIISDHLEMRLIVGDVHDEIEIRRAAEAEAHRLAYQDVLTGLPNRVHLQKVVAEGLPFPRQGILAAFAADLDGFKALNDTYGHFAGDELLRRTAETMTAILGERAFIARISGDEFVALIDGDSRQAIQAFADELVDKAAAPFRLAGHMMSNGVSVGVAFAEDDAPDVDILLRNADFALCTAKKTGRGRAAVFDEAMATETRRLAGLRHDLIAALRENAIKVFFQPIHKAPSGAMIGVEALARWNHPTLGAISPVEFITLAEESGHILELGEQVLRASLQAARGWDDIFVSVNLSPVQFRLSDLAANVACILAEARFPASRLQLEVTEGVLLDDLAAAKRQIEAISAIGVRIALDDFGTGYSSLNYLADLPFDKVKIDRSFVSGALHDHKRHAIIRHIVAMARDLGMRITAEGIETEDDAVLMTATGCTSLQGYYFGRALPASEIGERLRAKRSAA